MSLGANKQALMGAAGASSAASSLYSYQIGNSIRMSTSANSRLYRTAGTPTSSDKMTLSFWVKRHDGSDDDANNLMFTAGTSGGAYFYMNFTGPGDGIKMENVGGNQGTGYFTTNAVFPDPFAWYHIIFRIDTTQSSADDRIRLYVNGELLTDYNNTSMRDNTAQDEDFSYLNQSGVVQNLVGQSGIGTGVVGANLSFADVAFYDGQSYYSEIGEFHNGVWRPKDPSSLTFGDNGYWLKFASSGSLGTDSSGNGNNFTVSNVGAEDQLLDSPTFGDSSSGNFAVLSSKIPSVFDGNLTLGEAATYITRSSAGNQMTIGSQGASSGKYYYEVYWNADSGVNNVAWGWINWQDNIDGIDKGDIQVPDAGCIRSNSNDTYLGGSTVTMNSRELDTGDIIGVAIDLDNGKIFFGQDGGSGSRSMNWNISSTGTGVPADGTNPALTFTAGDLYVPAFSISSIGATTFTVNFGQDSSFAGALTAQNNADGNGYGDFYYTPPSGYVALSSANAETDTGIDPNETDDDYPKKLFGAVKYTADGTSGKTITPGDGFRADIVWTKRTSTTTRQTIMNTSTIMGGVNGSSNQTKYLHPSNNVSEGGPSTDLVRTIGATSYTIGDGTYINDSGTYCNWVWRVNGGTTSSETAGSINTTVQVNQTAGVSIIQYVGDGGTSDFTLAHGLGKKPQMFWFKDRDTNGNNNSWSAFHTSMQSEYYMYLNSDAAEASSGNGSWKSVSDTLITMARTSSTGGGQTIGESGDNFLVYAWANIPGFSRFGKYMGNGEGTTGDGNFVYCGFQPAMIIVKKISGANNWRQMDNARDTRNSAYHMNVPNSEAAESALTDGTDYVDFLSNGFVVGVGGDATNWNADGATYVFGAWANNPLKYATGGIKG